MKRIVNPYTDIEGYSCFGCSPNNPYGLKMDFFEDGDDIVSIWTPHENFAGYKQVLHGGIQATLLDEIASWVVFVKLKTGGFTSNLDVTFKNPVLIDKGDITLRASLKEMEKNVAHIEVKLYDGKNRECSTAIASYFTLPERIARKKMEYPGIDSFFEK